MLGRARWPVSSSIGSECWYTYLATPSNNVLCTQEIRVVRIRFIYYFTCIYTYNIEPLVKIMCWLADDSLCIYLRPSVLPIYIICVYIEIAEWHCGDVGVRRYPIYRRVSTWYNMYNVHNRLGYRLG